MNWPPLTAECSTAIAEAIHDAVENKPKDLFEHVAKLLQDASGKDPAEYEAYFEHCKAQPRTYVLEERCPPNQDPMTWVAMRYNDDTILLSLQKRSLALVADILSEDPIDYTQEFRESLGVIYPEITYMRDTPEELMTFLAVKSIYLGCSGCKDVLSLSMDDADARLSFRCESLCTGARSLGVFEGIVNSGEDCVEALIICCMLRILGRLESFRARFGGGASTQEAVILHAIEHEADVLPSYQRLSDNYKHMIIASMKANFPLDQLVTTEAVPAHFGRVKDSVCQVEGGLNFFMGVLLAEHLVFCRNAMVTDDIVDIVRLITNCLAAIEKYGPARAYELYLKKRAERHQWRLLKDDLPMRMAIRLSCLSAVEDSEHWGSIQTMVQNMEPAAKEILLVELGRKDGITDLPVFMLVGGSAVMSRAVANSGIGAEKAVLYLSKILGAASKSLDKSTMAKVVRLQLTSVATLVKNYRPGGVPFEDTQFVLHQAGSSDVVVKIAGMD